MSIQTFDAQSGAMSLRDLTTECVKVSFGIKVPTWGLCTERENAGKGVKKTTIVRPFEDSFINKYRQRAVKEMGKFGVSFDKGFLIRKSMIDQAVSSLQEIGKEFTKDVDPCVRAFHEAVQARVQEFIRDGQEAEAQKLERAYLDRGGMDGFRARCAFRFSVYEIRMVTEEEREFDALGAEAKGLVSTICAEVKQMVKHRKYSADGKKFMLKSHKDFFSDVIQKLGSLAFINPKIAKFQDDLRAVVMPVLDKSPSLITDADRLVIGGAYAKVRAIDKVIIGADSLDAIHDADENGDIVDDSPSEETVDWVSQAVQVQDAQAAVVEATQADEVDVMAAVFGANTEASDVEEVQAEEVAVEEVAATQAQPELNVAQPVAKAVNTAKNPPVAHVPVPVLTFEESNW